MGGNTGPLQSDRPSSVLQVDNRNHRGRLGLTATTPAEPAVRHRNRGIFYNLLARDEMFSDDMRKEDRGRVDSFCKCITANSTGPM